MQAGNQVIRNRSKLEQWGTPQQLYETALALNPLELAPQLVYPRYDLTTSLCIYTWLGTHALHISVGTCFLLLSEITRTFLITLSIILFMALALDQIYQPHYLY